MRIWLWKWWLVIESDSTDRLGGFIPSEKLYFYLEPID